MRKYYLIMGLMSVAAFQSYSQSNTKLVTGIVKSVHDNNNIEGVRIQVKGRNYSSGTMADGIFYIELLPKDSVLEVSHPGYETKIIKITGESEYYIELPVKAVKEIKVRKSSR